MSIGFIGNHFYTSSIVERDNAINNLGFVDESHYDSIYIFKQQVRDSKRLYRYFNANVGDHFYCTDQADQQRALSGGYIDESDVDVMYVFGDVISFGAGESPPRTTQLRRFFLSNVGDHFYSTNQADADRALRSGYVEESGYDVIYVPTMPIVRDGVTAVRLWRLYHPATSSPAPPIQYFDFCVVDLNNNIAYNVTASGNSWMTAHDNLVRQLNSNTMFMQSCGNNYSIHNGPCS